MPSFDTRCYMKLPTEELRLEYETLRDSLNECGELCLTGVDPRYIEMLLQFNDSNKLKLRERMEEIKRQARRKGVKIE